MRRDELHISNREKTDWTMVFCLFLFVVLAIYQENCISDLKYDRLQLCNTLDNLHYRHAICVEEIK